jgi:K+-sensing histidine kinase KdpD
MKGTGLFTMPSFAAILRSARPTTTFARARTRTFFRYGIAVLSVAISSWFRFQLSPYLETTFLFGTFAIVITTQLAGGGPGLLALALSIVSVDYLILPPRGALGISGPGQWIGFALFSFVGAAIAALAESQRRSHLRAQEAVLQSEFLYKDERCNKERTVASKLHETLMKSSFMIRYSGILLPSE